MAEPESDLTTILPEFEFQAAPLLEHLTCPVCMDVMRNATITVPCAHTFCGKCVRQALNLKHECPLCKAPLQAENLMPNRQCDALIDTLEKEKAAATARYFERLATARVESRTVNELSVDRYGKVEAAFRQHHQQAMIAFHSMVDNVRRAFAVRSKRVEECKQTDTCGEAFARAELERLQLAEDACVDQLAADYEKHLSEAMAPLPLVGELAPTIHVDVCTQSAVKSIAIRLTNAMFIDDLRSEVLRRMAEADDPLVALPAEGVRVVAYYPGARAGGHLAQALHDSMDASADDAGVELDASRPLVHQSTPLLTGSRIVFCGAADGVQLKLVSEVATECFRTTFVRGSYEICDYYCCNTCSIKWICGACALGPCHAGKGHDVVAFALKHKANYGACYCKKRKGRCCLGC